MLDANGYPTNPEYLMAQGFDPVEANRQLVELQERSQLLDQVRELMTTGSPQQIQEFFTEYNKMNGGQQPQAQRPEFPGGQPGDSQAMTEQDLGAYYNMITSAAKTGNPLDVIVHGGQTDMDQAIANIPDAAWRAMAPYLIQGDF